MCKQLLPKIYSSCIFPEPMSSNGSLHSLLNPGQPKCITNISTIEGLAFRPWKQQGNWRPSGQFQFQTPRGSFRGFTAYPHLNFLLSLLLLSLSLLSLLLLLLSLLSIPSPRKRMPGDTCFDDVGRNCACVTWTQMYVTLQTKNVFHSKAVIILFF